MNEISEEHVCCSQYREINMRLVDQNFTHGSDKLGLLISVNQVYWIVKDTVQSDRGIPGDYTVTNK